MKNICTLILLMLLMSCSTGLSNNETETVTEQSVKPTETATQIPPTKTLEPTTTKQPTQTSTPISTQNPTNTAVVILSPTADPILDLLASISGKWEGWASNKGFNMSVVIIIEDDCDYGNVCGSFELATVPCSGSLIFEKYEEEKFVFTEDDFIGNCAEDAITYLAMYSESKILYESTGSFGKATGVLKLAE